ncbi:MAG: toll/interleukin-1 receptor domain-containing protein [Rickettsiales bacterium]|nr:MAG: toll/interleukin-1 receptor domain-containing protein [Rickettsiales bacterium]
MVKLFFSYSHKDEELRNELDKHLSILKRQGIISAWHDRCIIGGSELSTEISNNLKTSNIILLLISSDFLASDYCYDNEMKFAMEMHESGAATVLPVILRPCDWHETPFGKLLATPKDGKSIIKFPILDEAFLEVTNEIKRIAKNAPDSPIDVPAQLTIVSQVEPSIRSSNLKIKKTFNDQEKDQFLDDAFDYIAKYFENSLIELQKRNDGVTHRFKRVDSETFTSSIYVDGKAKSECTIFYGGNSFYGHSKSISFSYGITNSKNSLNESLSIAEDGYQLYLKQIGLGMMGNSGTKLTFEGAAEYYWEMFILHLQQ